MSTPDFYLPQSREQAVAHAITVEMMPDLRVSDRTQRTYAIGAETVLRELMSGRWDQQNSERHEQILGEFVGKVILNARRQGIKLDLRPRKK